MLSALESQHQLMPERNATFSISWKVYDVRVLWLLIICLRGPNMDTYAKHSILYLTSKQKELCTPFSLAYIYRSVGNGCRNIRKLQK